MASAEALNQLGWSDSEATLRVLAAIRRSNIAGCVCEGPVAFAPLIGALRGFDFNVRQIAAKALARLGDPRAIEPLIEALENSYQCNT